MQKDSVKVTPGARVKRGEVLGKLGNTSNTSAPHLHFHLMDGTSVLGSSGLPYLTDSFPLRGEFQSPISRKPRERNGTGAAECWRRPNRVSPRSGHRELPL